MLRVLLAVFLLSVIFCIGAWTGSKGVVVMVIPWGVVVCDGLRVRFVLDCIMSWVVTGIAVTCVRGPISLVVSVLVVAVHSISRRLR